MWRRQTKHIRVFHMRCWSSLALLTFQINKIQAKYRSLILWRDLWRHSPAPIAFVHKTCQQSFGCLNTLRCMRKIKTLMKYCLEKFITNCDKGLLQIATAHFITNYDKELLQIARGMLLQVATSFITNCDVITNCDSTYSLGHFKLDMFLLFLQFILN